MWRLLFKKSNLKLGICTTQLFKNDAKRNKEQGSPQSLIQWFIPLYKKILFNIFKSLKQFEHYAGFAEKQNKRWTAKLLGICFHITAEAVLWKMLWLFQGKHAHYLFSGLTWKCASNMLSGRSAAYMSLLLHSHLGSCSISKVRIVTVKSVVYL